MDSLTHLAAGALTPLMFRKAPRQAGLVIFGILAGELPDIDFIAGNSALAMLYLHRGFTHSMSGILFLSVLLTVICKIALGKMSYKTNTVRIEGGVAVINKPSDMHFFMLWSIVLLAMGVHVYLDCMTTFGTQIFWPFSNFRMAIPAMFIVDPLFTIPLLLLACHVLFTLKKPNRDDSARRWARRGLVWILVYPVVCLGINQALAFKHNRDLAADNPHNLTKISLTPMPLSPFYWKAVGENEREYRLAMTTADPTAQLNFGSVHAKPNPEIWQALQNSMPIFRYYANFASFPAMEQIQSDKHITLSFQDLRYAPAGPDDLTAKAGRGDGMFIMQVRANVSGIVEAWRYLKRGDDAAETPWLDLYSEEIPRSGTVPAQPAPEQSADMRQSAATPEPGPEAPSTPSQDAPAPEASQNSAEEAAGTMEDEAGEEEDDALNDLFPDEEHDGVPGQS